MRFGLQRSVIFWAGVLMTVFIGWAVRDSREYASVLRAGEHTLTSECGGVVVRRIVAVPGRSFWQVERNGFVSSARRLEGAFFLRGQGMVDTRTCGVMGSESYHALSLESMRYRPIGEWIFYLPYWLLWMVMGVLWLGLLVWRQRRGVGDLIDER